MSVGERRPASPLSPALLIPLTVAALLGTIGGSAFRWAAPGRDWEIFTAALLWTLISAAGTTLGRYYNERLRRGEWRRGLRVALVQSLPLTTVFLLVAALAGAGPRLFAVAAVPYACTLALALFVAALGVLSSPYRR